MDRLSKHVYSVTTPYEGAYVRTYLVAGETAVVIDTGLESTGDAILELLVTLGSPRVLAAIHTHCHWDHIGSTHRVREATGCLTAAHTADADMLSSYAENDRRFLRMFPEFPPTEQDARDIYDVIGPETHVDLRLTGGECFDLGRGVLLDIVPMPGHTQGCVGVLERASGSLFTGDALAGRGPFGTLVQYEDVAAYRQTVERVRSLGVNTILAGHLDPITCLEVACFLDDCLDEVDKVGEHVRAAAEQGECLVAVAQGLCARMNKGFRLQALMTTQAHLADMNITLPKEEHSR